MAINPFVQFTTERSDAFAAKDPMAALCTVATTEVNNLPNLRTLVLRDLDDQLAIFVNATSPKWPHLQKPFAVLTYWPSIQIQYRMTCTGIPIDDKIVHDSWQLRPPPPKTMDWFYNQHAPQSSTIGSREELLNTVDNVDLPDPLTAPSQAKGLQLNIVRMERLDLTQTNGIHDRTLYEKEENGWSHTTLVP